MNTPHCTHCGRAVSEVDRAGGTCPWCGRVLVVMQGRSARSSGRSTSIARAARGSSGRSTNWSYWWVPLVGLIAIRGMTSCNRVPSSSYYTPPTFENNFRSLEQPTFDAQQLLERIEQQQREFAAHDFDYVAEPDDFADIPDLEFNLSAPPLSEVLRQHREVLERSRPQFESPQPDKD